MPTSLFLDDSEHESRSPPADSPKPDEKETPSLPENDISPNAPAGSLKKFSSSKPTSKRDERSPSTPSTDYILTPLAVRDRRKLKLRGNLFPAIRFKKRKKNH